ncbi:OLC1v1023669C1 [Oldenlandia corymbosa var. corymbosa]|nr:OLC1v1023669C1 [Oldenlandia corymbosa var. corymbosa]
MGSLAGGGNWGPFGMGSNNFDDLNRRRRRRRRNSGESKASSSGEIAASGSGYRFPVKQAATAASLCFTGDTIAQVRQNWVKHKDNLPDNPLDVAATLLSEHDWVRALRLSSFSFLLHGPGSYAWYQFLDRLMPIKSPKTLLIKVIMNQLLLGPTTTASAFTWNNLWLGRGSQLPEILKNDAIPALIFG